MLPPTSPEKFVYDRLIHRALETRAICLFSPPQIAFETRPPAGFYLEATTLVESLLAERLEKRAQWLWDSQPEMRDRLSRVKDGFNTLGALTWALSKAESVEDLRDDINEIRHWTAQRNDVIHEMAKLGQGAQECWSARYVRARHVSEHGIRLLLKLDLHERREAHAGRNKRYASATCPNALGPLGQLACEWCETTKSRSTTRVK